jgi:hypothetical protein
MTKGKMLRATCGDCGAQEGQLHNFPLQCDMEVCPFGGGQLLSCLQGMGCDLGDPAITDDEQKRRVNEKGRIPFIV